MKILALDLGTKTGWATAQESGTVKFENGRHEGGGMRFLRFRRWLDELKDLMGGIDAVFYEEVRAHKGTAAAHAYGGFHGHLTAWCEENEIPYSGVPVGTIKRFATGKGNCGKAEMKAAFRNRWGREPVDDNQADAAWLLAWAQQEFALSDKLQP